MRIYLNFLLFKFNFIKYIQRLPKEPREYQSLVRSASDSTWRHDTAANPMFVQRLSHHFVYNGQDYMNPHQDYVIAQEKIEESSEKSSIGRMRSLSAGEVEGINNDEARKTSLDTESPYARINKENRLKKFEKESENLYSYLL